MANLIDEIVSQKAFDELERLKRELAEAQKSIEAFYKQTGSMPKFGGAGTATSELEKMVGLTKRLTEQIQVYGSVAGKALAEAQQAKRELVNETKLLVQQEQAEEGSINQLRASLNLLTKQYESMGKAAREGLGGKELHARIMATRTEVDKLEQSLGNYKRNVGNYTNATFQLSQVFRELPAFTYSAQTGVMALSNNLPMLADAFRQVSQATNETTGKVNGTMGALKIFGQSIFSLGNIFTLAMSAFLIFNKEIMAFFKGADEFSVKMDDIRESVNGATEDMGRLRLAMQQAKDGLISKEEALKVYNETLGKATQETKDFNEAEKITEQQGDAYIQMTIMKARAAKMLANAIKLATDAAEMQDDWWTTLKAQVSEGWKAFGSTGNPLLFFNRNPQDAYEAYRNQAQAEADAAEKAWIEEENRLAQFMKEHGFNSIDEKKEREKKEKEKKEKEPFKPEFRFDDDDYENIKKYYDELVKNLEKVWKEVKPYFEQQIVEDIEGSMNSLVMPVLDPKSAASLNAQLMNRAKQNKKNLDDQKAAAEELKELFTAIENLANSITQSLTTINDIINQRINIEFDAREKRMNEYYDNEEYRIKSTMINGVAKEQELMKIQAQRDAQQKKLDRERLLEQRKGAAREKAINIAGIIANTALGITRALSDTGIPPYIRWINAVAVGGVGTAQLAAVIAQPLPQFAKGTESSPEGYAVVGEKGHELVVEPSGKKWVTPAKDTITYLKKGSKVIPNDKLMTMVRDSAYVELANMNMPVTPDLYAKALVDQFDELANKVDKLSSVMSNKDMRVNIVGNFDHYMHVKRNIK